MPKSQSQSFQDFRKELIRRFFNPRSYFFLCLSTQLQDMDHIAADISEDDYLLIGQVMQRLVDSSQPEQDLAALQILTRFQDFHHTLDESLHHLYQPGLAPDEMKQIIEGLAHDFVEVLIDVLHDPVEKKRLLGLMHLDQTLAEAAPLTDAKIMELNESVVETFDDMPELLDEDDPQKKAALSSEDSQEAEAVQGAESNLSSVIIEEKQPSSADQTSLEAADELVFNAFEDQNGKDGFSPIPEPTESETADPDIADELAPIDAESLTSSPWSNEAEMPAPDKEQRTQPAEARDEEKAEKPSMRLELQQDFPSESLAEDLLAPPGKSEERQTDEQEPVSALEAQAEPTAPEPALPIAEPEGLASLFAREIQSLVDTVRLAAAQCQAGRFPQKALKQLRRALLDIRESAMIHGYQEVEDMARKGQALIDRLRRERKPITESLVHLLQDFPVKIDAAMRMQDEPELDQTVREFVQALNKAMLTPFAFEYTVAGEPSVDLARIVEQQRPAEQESPAATPSQQNAAQADADTTTETPAAEEGHSAQEPLTKADLSEAFGRRSGPSDLQDQPTENIDGQAEDMPAIETFDKFEMQEDRLEPEPLAKAGQDHEGDAADWQGAAPSPEEDLPLPGEDDPELIQLIQEVAGHRAESSKQETTTQQSVKGATLQDYLQKLASFDEASETATVDSAIREFRREAKLYFRVASEALAQLEKSPQDRLAWENLELTCYSLKGLAQKLGLDLLARLPGYVEELASLVLQRSLMVESVVLVHVAKGLTFLSEIADNQDIEASRFQEVEKEILRCITDMQKVASNLVTRPAVMKPAAGQDATVKPRQGQLKLSGKESARAARHAESQNTSFTNSIENLDFLMNDDSDLLGLED
ncbi:MAG: hypothetical protein Q9P90_11555 [candidate division KSB1 bacterium]|nr:hypothetical protein [candidate division KSB1 bacterium]